MSNEICIYCEQPVNIPLHAMNNYKHERTQDFYECQNKNCERYGLISTVCKTSGK